MHSRVNKTFFIYYSQRERERANERSFDAKRVL